MRGQGDSHPSARKGLPSVRPAPTTSEACRLRMDWRWKLGKVLAIDRRVKVLIIEVAAAKRALFHHGAPVRS